MHRLFQKKDPSGHSDLLFLVELLTENNSLDYQNCYYAAKKLQQKNNLYINSDAKSTWHPLSSLKMFRGLTNLRSIRSYNRQESPYYGKIIFFEKSIIFFRCTHKSKLL